MNDKLVSESGKSCERNGVDQGGSSSAINLDEEEEDGAIDDEDGMTMTTKRDVYSGNRPRSLWMHNVLVWTDEIPNLKIITQEAFEEKYVYWKPDDEKLCERYKTDDSGQDLFAGR
eukprot:jgi/Bigna1/147642/aug1.282_g22350